MVMLLGLPANDYLPVYVITKTAEAYVFSLQNSITFL